MKLLRKKIIFLIFIQFFLLIHLILIFCENLKIKKSIFRSESISHVLFLSHYFQLISKILILFVIQIYTKFAEKHNNYFDHISKRFFQNDV